MDLLHQFVEIFLHLDKHLEVITAQYGVWTYGILFCILFAETGLVVTPFLPGDSLLFAAGTLASLGSLHVSWLFGLLLVAVFLGDNVNYWIGYFLGPKVFHSDSRLLNKEHLNRTHRFFEKYGTKTIIMARFVPIVRTCTPFVAGIGRMPYPRFLQFSILGCCLWLSICLMSGFYFGSMPWVKKHFSVVILAIIFISIVPAVVEFLRHRHDEQ